MSKAARLGLYVVVTFCLGALVGVPIRGALATTPPPDDQFSYLCLDARDAADLNQKLNQAGAKGWRVVGSSPGPQGSVWCLSKFGPSPLAQAK